MANWPVAETYTNTLGQFVGYDTTLSSGVTNTVLGAQKHIDIRGFVPSGVLALGFYSMLEMDTISMSTLDALDMAQLEVKKVYGDNWSHGTLGPIAFLNNTVGLKWTLASGVNMTTSTLAAVNLSTGFQPNDYICLSLPSFPSGFINEAQSYVSLSDGVNTTQLSLGSSSVAVTSGNTCAAWPYSSLGAVQEPTTVTLNMVANTACNIYVTGLRLISQGWTPLSLDINTQGQFLRNITTQSGTLPSVPLPLAYRSAVPQGVEDPRPINSNFGALFFTGSLQSSNSISLYFRERQEALVTQAGLDFNPPFGGFIQENLDNLGFQPDYSQSIYPPASGVGGPYYIEANLAYQTNGSFTITLTNFTSIATNTYTFTGVGLQPQNYYYFSVNIQDTAASVAITPVTSVGVLSSTSLFTSPTISNTSFRRTAGRIGWSVQLGDGDAFIASFVGQSLLFAEYKSKVFQSFTPVKGASLVVSATPPTPLITATVPSNEVMAYGGGTISANLAISASVDGSTQINATGAGQGLQTIAFTVSNFNNFEIVFDLYVPLATFPTLPFFALMNSVNYVIPLNIGSILPNTWQTIIVPSTAFLNLLPDSFSFITLSTWNTPTTWYIDNLAISQASIVWSARSCYQDPWNANPIPWQPFTNLLNNLADGVTFSPPGPALQVRAQAFSQGSVIDKFLVTPQYSTLGNLIFSD